MIADLVPGSPSPQDKAKYSLNLKVLTTLAEIRPGDVKQHKARDWGYVTSGWYLNIRRILCPYCVLSTLLRGKKLYSVCVCAPPCASH